MTRYMLERKNRIENQKIRDYAVFGQLGGLIFCVLGFMRWLITVQTVFSFLLSGVMLFGLYLIISGLICPQPINWFYKVFNCVGNGFGRLIFQILLSIIYIVFLLPVSVLVRKKKSDYLYISWDQIYPGIEKSGFKKWRGSGFGEQKGMLGITLRLIGLFIDNGQRIFVPIVVLLIVFGVILFFVSSTVIAPFIYTLF